MGDIPHDKSYEGMIYYIPPLHTSIHTIILVFSCRFETFEGFSVPIFGFTYDISVVC
jgi:hypothetical protein